MKSEEINQLLADKFKRESHRLKSWGTKTDDKAAVSFAMAVSEFVRALMAKARYRELQRLVAKIEHKSRRHRNLAMGLHVLDGYIRERMDATKTMAKAIENLAVKKESERPYGHKEKKHKHKHHSHHHGHS